MVKEVFLFFYFDISFHWPIYLFYHKFELEEIKLLINEVGLNIDNEFYDCGNNVFILSNN